MWTTRYNEHAKYVTAQETVLWVQVRISYIMVLRCRWIIHARGPKGAYNHIHQSAVVN